MRNKRVLYSVVAAATALGLSLHYQLNSLERRANDYLRALPNLQFASADIRYFPSPRLTLSQLNYPYQQWTLSAEQATLQFSWLSLFSFAPKVQQAELVGGELSAAQQPQWRNLAFKLRDIDSNYRTALLDLSVESAGRDRLQLNAQIGRFPNGVELYDTALKAEMAEGYFLNNQALEMHARKISLSQQQTLLQLVLQQAQLNQLPLKSAVLHYSLVPTAAPKPHFRLQLSQQSGNLTVDSIRRQQDNLLVIKGRKLELSPLLEFLQLPVLLRGKADFDGDAVFEQGVLMQGKLRLRATETALNGLNLIEMISQYYPLRQGAQKYADRIETPFNQLDMALNWRRDKLNLTRIQAQGEDLNLSGKGEMNLMDLTCRLDLRLSPTQSGYSQFQLPVSLFGPCQSPQYRISIDRKLGNQLKQLLKEKLKERN
ncbi:hypothetical protein ACUHGC_12665 [Testudinibacter sp. P27/CKL/0425]